MSSLLNRRNLPAVLILCASLPGLLAAPGAALGASRTVVGEMWSADG